MIRETIAITSLGLRSIPERFGPSLVIVVGLAGVVAVFTALLAMAEGFRSTLESTGRNDVALVLRGGSSAELNSGLTRDQGLLIKQLPGVAAGADGQPLASAEMIVIAELIKTGEKTGSNITVRGVEPAAFTLRPQLKIVEGRAFQPGLRELIVGRGVAQQFEGARLGETLRMRGSDWTVVGIFESGDANDSELWADVEVGQTTFNRRGYSSIRLQLDGPGALETVKAAAAAEPRINVDVETEQQYYSGQTRQFRRTIGALAGIGGDVWSASMSGVDLTPVLRDGSERVRDHVLFAQAQGWHPSCLAQRYALRGVFDGRHKYVRYFGVGGGCDNLGRSLDWAPEMRFGPDASFGDQEHELYDLADDPGELHNLAHEGSRRGEVHDRFGHLLELEAAAFRQQRPPGPGGGSTHAAQMLDRSGFFDA